MKQVELREETLKQEHESRVAILEDRIENLSQRLKQRDEEIEAQKTQSGKLEETKRKLTRQLDQMVNELRSVEDKRDQFERQLDEAKVDIEVLKKEAQLRMRSQEDQEKEVAAFRREIDMKDIEIKLHDSKLRQMKDDNTRTRMQLRDSTLNKRGALAITAAEPSQAAGLVDEFERVQQQYDMLTL